MDEILKKPNRDGEEWRRFSGAFMQAKYGLEEGNCLIFFQLSHGFAYMRENSNIRYNTGMWPGRSGAWRVTCCGLANERCMTQSGKNDARCCMHLNNEKDYYYFLLSIFEVDIVTNYLYLTEC